MHGNVDQSSFLDAYTDIESTYTWTDDIGLDLLFSDRPCPQLSSGHGFKCSEHCCSLGPPVVEETIPPMSRSATVPSRDYTEASEDLSDILVPINSDKQPPGLNENYSDKTLPDSQQDHSSTKPMIPISPFQQLQPPNEPINGSMVEPNQSLLYMAIDSGHEGIIRIILDQGIDINERYSDGSTALHMAVQKRQEKILPLLLENGADVNAVDGDDRTPIHMAIYSDFQTGLKMLLGQKS